MQKSEQEARAGAEVAQEAEALEREGDFCSAYLWYCSAAKILMSSIALLQQQKEVGPWADEPLRASLRTRSRECLERAEKLSKLARISERSEVSVRAHRARKVSASASSGPPTAILVEIPTFDPPPAPHPPPPPPLPEPFNEQAAVARLLVRGILHSARMIRVAQQHSSFPVNVPYAVNGDRGETYEVVDHSPANFARLRAHARVADAHIESFTSAPLVSLRATGRSGSFFYSTGDGRFVIKSINEDEHACLSQVTDDYFLHVTSVAASLLVRFYGHFTFRLMSGGGFGFGSSSVTATAGAGATGEHIVVMENLFPRDRSLISEVWDLKGSTYKREATEQERQRIDRVLKDNDLIKGPRHTFRLSPPRRALLVHAIESDAQFLESHGVMDYSLLVGVRRRSGTAAVAAAAASSKKATPDQEWPGSPFVCDGGGFASSSDSTSEVYHIGIIDFLQPYNVRKRVESTFKSLVTSAKKTELSSVDPSCYARRFRDFLAQVFVTDPSRSRSTPPPAAPTTPAPAPPASPSSR